MTPPGDRERRAFYEGPAPRPITITSNAHEAQRREFCQVPIDTLAAFDRERDS
jgi:hypothetical protein